MIVMKRKGDIEEDIELRDEIDEVDDDTPARKKEKKGKSKEQRSKERMVVFWTMVIVFLVTAIFWLLPTIRGEKEFMQDSGMETREKTESGGGFVKYEL